MPPSTAATTRSRRSIEYARMASAVPIKQSAHCCQTTVGDRFEDGRPARCCTAAVLRCPGSRSFRGPCSSWGSRHSAGCRLLVALVLAVVVVVPVVLAAVVGLGPGVLGLGVLGLGVLGLGVLGLGVLGLGVLGLGVLGLGVLGLGLGVLSLGLGLLSLRLG